MTPREYLRRREEALRTGLRADAHQLVGGADESLDLSGRVRRHPWIGLGSGALAGWALGALVGPASAARLARGAVRRSIGLATALLLPGLAGDPPSVPDDAPPHA